MLSKFLRPSDVRAQWQDCITKAWNERGVSLSFGASGAVIDVRPITARNHSAIETAILEVCKYAGKGSAWLALSDSDLLAVSELKRFNRLFESFGESYGKFDSESRQDIRLDTHNLTAGEKLKTTKPKTTNDLSTLNLKVNVTRTFRKAQLIARYPVAVFRTLDGRDFLPSEPLESVPLRLIKPMEIKLMKQQTKQLPNFLNNPVSELESELGLIEDKMKDAARAGNQTALVSLRERKAQLPALVVEAKRKDLVERFSVARSRIAAFETELQAQSNLSRTLSAEIEPKLQQLDKVKAELIANERQAQSDRETLLFALKLEQEKHAALVSEQASLLLSHFGTD
jgi:hypothetical protein